MWVVRKKTLCLKWHSGTKSKAGESVLAPCFCLPAGVCRYKSESRDGPALLLSYVAEINKIAQVEAACVIIRIVIKEELL